MSTWLTESEFRQSGARATGVTINVAFLQDIKEDNVQFKEVLSRTAIELSDNTSPDPRTAVDVLIGLQDELETHFALEEFFGYFQNARLSNPSIGRKAEAVRNEHQKLFLQLNEIVDLAEQVLYRECNYETTMDNVIQGFDQFLHALESHETREAELMMQLYNEEIGVGD